MKKNLTYIIFVVDRSGSMNSIKKDMIGGFNSFIADQRKIKKDCKVFFYQFDNVYESVYEGVDIDDIKDLTETTYVPRGNTALYPSLGKTIDDIGKRLSAMPEEERPERVLFVTITDGEHNSNLRSINGEYVHQYTSDQVKKMIKHQTDIYKWDFAYIGANQDAWNIGTSIGICSNLNYVANSKGTQNMWDELNVSTKTYRSSGDKVKFTFTSN